MHGDDQCPADVPGFEYEGVAQYYDLFAPNDDIPFYLNHARTLGSPVLDIAAGTGRITFRLARAGIEVVALERSPSMLAYARRILEGLAPDVRKRITMIEGDMREFDLGRTFPLIIIPGAFNHALTATDRRRTITCVVRHMTRESLFIMDIIASDVGFERAGFREGPRRLPGGGTVIRDGVVEPDRERGVLMVHLRYLVRTDDGNGFIREVTSGLAVISDTEIRSLLREAGLEIMEEYGGFNGQPYTVDCERRILVLRKTRT